LPAFGLFCNPESRRVEGFSRATGRWLRQWPVLVPWLSVLQQKDWQPALFPAPQFLRLESPGRNWTVEKLLLLKGAGIKDEEPECGWREFSPETLEDLKEDRGCLWPMRQWFRGWRRLLEELDVWAQGQGLSQRWCCPPEDVVCMFDKAACQRLLESRGLPVAPVLGIPRNFDHLWELMRAHGRRRVFLKSCHGSSGAGIVAMESSGSQIQAFTTVELLSTAGGLQLYNQRRIRTIRGAGEVRLLVDAVCRERCLAQVWVPKAGLLGKPFDVRVVVIGGKARQAMVRLGRGPITSSQLLGGKAEVTRLSSRMGQDHWEEVLRLCERAMAKCFPRSLYAGFDVLIEPNFRTARILEVNAFGDLLPRLLHQNRETYEWEVLSLFPFLQS
jgi:glutathione synthase/RimK-type ligase-like ATP-grasp enzyme